MNDWAVAWLPCNCLSCNAFTTQTEFRNIQGDSKLTLQTHRNLFRRPTELGLMSHDSKFSPIQSTSFNVASIGHAPDIHPKSLPHAAVYLVSLTLLRWWFGFGAQRDWQAGASGVKSGDWGCHVAGSPRPIQRSGNPMLRKSWLRWGLTNVWCQE